MNAGQFLILFAQIVTILQKEGLLDAKGNFIDDFAAEARAVAAIERQLTADGVVIPDRVDKIIQILPLVLAMVK